MVQDGTIETDHDEPRDPARARAAERARDAQLVRAAVDGDDRAFGELYDLWFDRVFNLVRRILRDDDSAAEVAQDAFLSAWRSLAKLDDPDAFGGWLLRIARNAAYNRSTREARSRPVDDRTMAVIEGSGASPISAPSGFGIETRLAREEDPQAAVADGEIALLVRETVESLGERDAEVLDLQLRYGMTPAEIGEVIGVNGNAANQLCHRVKGRFATAFGARMLWNGTRPACDKLDALLRSAGIDAFGSEAVKIADKHAKTCDTCDERRELRLQPSALFAALPLLAAPGLLKAKAAAALAAEGVPMAGSSAAASSPGPGSGGTGSGGSASSPTVPTNAASTGAPGGPESESESGPEGEPEGEQGLDDEHEHEDEDEEQEDGDTSVRSRKTLAVIGLGILVLALLLGGLIVSRSGDNSDIALVGGEPGAEDRQGGGTTEDLAGTPLDPSSTTTVDPSADPTGSSVDLGSASDPNSNDGEPTQDPSADPSSPPPGPDVDPGPAAPIPSLDVSFEGTEVPRSYPWRDAPQLEWATGGAVEVRVWEWIDGVPTRVISTELSGSSQLCPGRARPLVCTVPGSDPIEVSYVIEAVNADGVVTSSDRTNRPGFTVLPLPG